MSFDLGLIPDEQEGQAWLTEENYSTFPFSLPSFLPPPLHDKSHGGWIFSQLIAS